jgi:hypothetical protein
MFAIFLAFIAFPAQADIPEIMSCADKTDPDQRLACYDAAVVKLKADLVTARNRKLSLFGFTLPSLNGANDDAKSEPQPALNPQEVKQINANVANAAEDGFGHIVLTLDNGEVWKVQDQTIVPLGAAHNKSVTISKNMFGGFYLTIVGQQSNLSVVRIR